MADPDWDNDPTIAGKGPLEPGARPAPEISLDAAASADLEHPSFAPGYIVAGRFKILRFLARGGMGEVYEVEDLELGERVALKTVRLEMAQQGHAVERFRREIQLARKVTHPNVCRTFDAFRHSGASRDGAARETLVVSMELLAGDTLEHHITRAGRLPEADALPIIVQIAAGLQAAHQAGVVHRDFKSSNVILVRAGDYPGGVRAVITDFGLARADQALSAQTLTSPNAIVGTPAYMAPEQLEGGEITPATDIYSLGIVMFHMATGALPFAGDSAMEVAVRRLKETAPSPRALVRELNPRWDTVISQCLERQPSKRFRTARQVADALTVPSLPLLPRLPAIWRRRKYFLLTLAAVLLAALAIGYVGMRYRFQLSDRARPSVAVIGFKNMSGNAEPDDLGANLTENLSTELGTSEIHVVEAALVDSMKRDLGWKEPPDSLSPADLEKIRDRLGCDVVIFGSYSAEGDTPQRKIAWNIHLERTRGGSSLEPVRETMSESAWLDAIPEVGGRVRLNLGVATASSEASRVNAALPANIEASTHFARGRQQLAQFDIQAAKDSFQSAIQADPKFAEAHSALADVWWQLGYEDKARSEAKTALALAGALSRDRHDLIQARYDEMNGDWNAAGALYSSLWREPSTSDPQYGLLLARSQTSGGKPADALATLGDLRRTRPAPGIAAQVDLAEADAERALAKYPQQLDSASLAAKESQALGAGNLLGRARVSQCLAELSLGQPAKAGPLCAEAKKLNETSGDKLGTAVAVNAIANALYDRGDYGQASPLYQQALTLARSISDKLDEAGALNNLANIKASQGDYAGAQRAYQDSIRVARERADNYGLALAEQNLGMMLAVQGMREGAREAFDQAVALAHSTGAKDVEALALDSRCMMEEEGGELGRAIEDCQGSLDLREKTGDKAAIARSLQDSGKVCADQGKFSEAKNDYQRALSIDRGLAANGDAAYSELLLAEAAVLEKRPADARAGALQAAREFASESDKDSEAEARRTLATAFLDLGDVPSAQTQIREASDLLHHVDDRYLSLEVEITAARVSGAAGALLDGMAALRETADRARTAGLLAAELEARLALGELEVKAGRTSDGRATLAAVAQQARARGFAYIAETATKEKPGASS